MSAAEEKEPTGEELLSTPLTKDVLMSELSGVSVSETLRKGEILRKVQNELTKPHPVRDLILSVRDRESGDRVELGSSSAHLISVSGYFEALHASDAIERGETVRMSDKVTVSGMRGVNAVAFHALSEVKLTVNSLAELIAAAWHCDCPGLKEACEEYSKLMVISRDITSVIKVIKDLQNLGFETESDRFLESVCESAFLSPLAMDMDEEMFVRMLRSDWLSVSEERVWTRVVEWARHQASVDEECTIMDVLNRLKPHVRFPLLNESFRVTEVVPIGLLSPKELLDVALAAHDQPVPGGLFCDSHRRKMTDRWDVRKLDITGALSVDETGLLLRHPGENEWMTAVVGDVFTRGQRSVMFEVMKSKDMEVMFGVLESGEERNNGYFSRPLRGLGYYAQTGQLVERGTYNVFGKSCTVGDEIKLSIDADQNTLDYFKNGVHIGHIGALDRRVDFSAGVRFAVCVYEKNSEVCIRHEIRL